jgi:non-homologous end joining protein Ku
MTRGCRKTVKVHHGLMTHIDHSDHWKGHISFGLVNITVSLHTAVSRPDIHFHLLDHRNLTKIHYERVNEETGEEVPWNEIVKAFEYNNGNYVIKMLYFCDLNKENYFELKKISSKT